MTSGVARISLVHLFNHEPNFSNHYYYYYNHHDSVNYSINDYYNSGPNHYNHPVNDYYSVYDYYDSGSNYNHSINNHNH